MNAAQNPLCLLLCSVPDIQTGRKIADALLTQKLAACVSIQPRIESHYVWKGGKELTTEYMLLIKTLETHWQSIQAAVEALHPYECPELVKLSDVQALPLYQKWIMESCS